MEERGACPKRRVVIYGEPCLRDIRSRTLENREPAEAVGFDEEEQHYEFRGNKGEATKQTGVAVPMQLAAALVRAALEPQL